MTQVKYKATGKPANSKIAIAVPSQSGESNPPKTRNAKKGTQPNSEAAMK